MPNWICGDLKVRGTKENIKKFLIEGLISTGSKIRPEIIRDDTWKFSIRSNTDFFYIKDTRRSFIEKEEIHTYINDWEDDEERVIVLEYKSAWGIDVVGLVNLSKEFNIDFKILGFELGMEFNQDVEIIKGEVIKNEEITFDDYEWECIRPHIGG
jgi:hypothetical protein